MDLCTWTRSRLVGLLGIGLLSWGGCSGGKDEPTDSGATDGPVVTWSSAFDTSGAGALSGVWGSGPDDVWMVGGSDAGGEIWHYDGASWTLAAAPQVGLLVWVYGFGPDDAIAVGVGGGVVRWDGASWTVIDSGTTEDLWGVWGASNDDIWIVGGDPDAGEPVILHHDGGVAFDPVALDPAQNDRLAHALFKVWGTGGRTFAVGQSGLVIEWDGSAWVQHPTGALADDDFVSLWGTSADHIVAVGGRSSAQLSTFDGAAWTTTEPDRVPGLSAIGMGAPNEAVIGGISGWVGRLDPTTGEIVAETPVDATDVHAIWFDGVDKYYGVAGHFTDPYFGTALVRTVEAP